MTVKKRYIVAVPDHVRAQVGLSVQDIVAGLPAERALRVGRAGTHVLELTDAEVHDLLSKHEGLLIEEDQDLHPLFPMPSLGFQIDAGQGQDLDFTVQDEETGKPIAGVTVFVQGVHGTYRGTTGKDGQAAVQVFETELSRVIASPAANYWSRVVAIPASGEPAVINLTPLRPIGDGAWGRTWLGLSAGLPVTGKGVKVAVMDSGIAEHPDLTVAGGFNTLDGGDPADFRRDDAGHGTHCAGVIAGRNGHDGVHGVAPEAALYSVKVFPGGRLSDLIEGIQWCIANAMDIISMSLGIRDPSPMLALNLTQAAQQGVTLVAAAGNDSGALSHPAADARVFAVTALGFRNAFPQDSAHALRVGELRNDDSGLFVANFSNSGPQTAFIAPGVAIVSSVPGGYAAWDGTSMACPFVAGLAALVLSAHPELRAGDASQSTAVHQLLAGSALDLSLPQTIQGAGLPQADRLLAPAIVSHQAAEQLAAVRLQDMESLAPLIADLEGKQQEIRALMVRLG